MGTTSMKVGDMVRIIDRHGYSSPRIGDEGVITEVALYGAEVEGDWPATPLFFDWRCLEAVPAPSPDSPKSPTADAIERPAHYTRWVIEPLTFIVANKLDFPTGNVIKYVMRHDAKNGLEDLQKARRYLDVIIEQKQREAAIPASAGLTSKAPEQA